MQSSFTGDPSTEFKESPEGRSFDKEILVFSGSYFPFVYGSFSLTKIIFCLSALSGFCFNWERLSLWKRMNFNRNFLLRLCWFSRANEAGERRCLWSWLLIFLWLGTRGSLNYCGSRWKKWSACSDASSSALELHLLRFVKWKKVAYDCLYSIRNRISLLLSV